MCVGHSGSVYGVVCRAYCVVCGVCVCVQDTVVVCVVLHWLGCFYSQCCGVWCMCACRAHCAVCLVCVCVQDTLVCVVLNVFRVHCAVCMSTCVCTSCCSLSKFLPKEYVKVKRMEKAIYQVCS